MKDMRNTVKRLYAAITLSSATSGKGKGLLLLLLFSLQCSIRLHAQGGLPFFQNFPSTEYKAHNQNFDIVADQDGTVYVANFEGLLYYDQASWRIIHTPGITRVTTLFRDSRGTLWTGGYNYIGRVAIGTDGILYLQSIGSQSNVHGEVMRFWEEGGRVCALVSDGSQYAITDTTLTLTSKKPLDEIMGPANSLAAYINQEVQLADGLKAIATNGEGVIITGRDGAELCRVNEAGGLCSNNVNRLAYNGHGLLWGATDNGIFAMAVPSAYSRFTSNEGLRGEVRCIGTLGNDIYVGTQNGLYRLQGNHFVGVKEMALACWQLKRMGDRLLAACADGLYAVHADRTVDFLTTSGLFSVMPLEGGTFLTGEMDGVYLNTIGPTGKANTLQRRKLWNMEKVTDMVTDRQGTLWLQNLYGSVWTTPAARLVPSVKGDLQSPTPYKPEEDEIRSLVAYRGQVMPVAAGAREPFPYPLFSYADDEGLLWLTDNKGRHLRVWRDDAPDEHASKTVYPLMDYSVRAMMRQKNRLWMGGDKGLCIVDNDFEDPTLTVKPRLLLRSVRLHVDSIIWGGYGTRPLELPELASNEHHIAFDYSIDFPSLLLATQYRTRLNEGNWSAWETATFEEYSNLTFGNFSFEVQARDAYGRLSDIERIDFRITPPIFLRWYMLLLYVALLAALVYALVRFRLYRLEKDKRRLEAVVKERTADLVEAQHELVRQEKMATVGKLTQGLIDRILNPLNYINNFAKLSESLIDDALANIQDEKQNISPDNYDDTIEVLGMLKGNLQKVGEHGANTSRVLKAMEEMLKDRTGGQIDMSLNDMLHDSEQMLHAYYEKEISTYHIATAFSLPPTDVHAKGNTDLLRLTVMSMLRNAVYAVVKKCLRQTDDTGYRPEVRLAMNIDNGRALITIHDNGTGIENTIIDRIFDPFFTTKTTGEASGVGLYISREIVQNHGGDITVESVKGEYTEFTITLPINKE